MGPWAPSTARAKGRRGDAVTRRNGRFLVCPRVPASPCPRVRLSELLSEEIEDPGDILLNAVMGMQVLNENDLPGRLGGCETVNDRSHPGREGGFQGPGWQRAGSQRRLGEIAGRPKQAQRKTDRRPLFRERCPFSKHSVARP